MLPNISHFIVDLHTQAPNPCKSVHTFRQIMIHPQPNISDFFSIRFKSLFCLINYGTFSRTINSTNYNTLSHFCEVSFQLGCFNIIDFALLDRKFLSPAFLDILIIASANEAIVLCLAINNPFLR